MASSKTTANTTWVSPRMWTAGELVTATIMNAHVRDQLTALKTPASGYGAVDEASDYTIASTTYTDVDATNLSMTLTTGGGIVFVIFIITTFCSSGSGEAIISFDIDVDGTRVGTNDGLAQTYVTSGGNPANMPVTVFAPVAGLSAGSHTFKLQWKRYTSTTAVGGMYAGAGTTNHDLHPQMFCVELA